MNQEGLLPSGSDEPSVNPEIEVDSRVDIARRIAIFFGIFGLLMVGATVIGVASHKSDTSNLINNLASAIVSPSPQDSSNSTATAGDTSWVPAGYTVWTNDSNIAWKWAKSGSFTCSIDASGGCYKAMFISQNGCPTNFYAAINLMDGSAAQGGNVIGYQNATLPALGAMQPAALEFDDNAGNSKSAQMSAINCG